MSLKIIRLIYKVCGVEMGMKIIRNSGGNKMCNCRNNLIRN